MIFIIEILLATWNLLVDASVYILFGLLVAGLLRVFLNPGSIATHLGQGRFKSVL
ncbi:MAG: permease, partial [Deltaproteobacteria bacterium]|nr:permease [Deltaproteobacteria bacterium]